MSCTGITPTGRVLKICALAGLLSLLSPLLPNLVAAQTANGTEASDPVVRETTMNGHEAQPGDRVVVKIWNEPEMSDTFTVSQSGNVILPIIGSMSVQDVPISSLEETLRTSYEVYLRNPSVQIEVLRRISVLGEVREPGIKWADLTMGLPELIARAGGPTEIADPNRVTLIRGTERIEFSRSNQSAMFVEQLRSGDQVIVGRKNILVRNPWAVISAVFTVLTLVRQLGII